ncbi:hypothetical protein D1872_259050 [compost metagenome]
MLQIDEHPLRDFLALADFLQMLQILFRMINQINLLQGVFPVPVTSSGRLSQGIQPGQRTNDTLKADIDTCFDQRCTDANHLLLIR